jgi:hypothetical protein
VFLRQLSGEEKEVVVRDDRQPGSQDSASLELRSVLRWQSEEQAVGCELKHRSRGQWWKTQRPEKNQYVLQ